MRAEQADEAVYKMARSIPLGKVATYGQIADAITQVRLTARDVGSALRFAPDDVPWHRVVGAGGWLTIARRSQELWAEQLSLLQKEGVAFIGEARDRVDLAGHQAWLTADSQLELTL